MGLVETLIDHASVQSVLVLSSGLLLAYALVAVILRPAWQELKLARMPGERATKIKAVAPFSKRPFLLIRPLAREQENANTTQVSTSSWLVSVRQRGTRTSSSGGRCSPMPIITRSRAA